MSEVFSEVVEKVTEEYSIVLQLSPVILEFATDRYAQELVHEYFPLDSCVGVIDCTKLRMYGRGGNDTNQRSVYSGNKRMHCLIYQTMTTPDGLIFAVHGTQEC